METMITKEALEEYKAIWRKQYPGKDIDDATAMDEAVRLLTAMDKIYRPVKKEWLRKWIEMREKDLEEFDKKQEAEKSSDSVN